MIFSTLNKKMQQVSKLLSLERGREAYAGFRPSLKNNSLRFNLYTAIIVLTFLASIFQLRFLESGIISRFSNLIQTNAATIPVKEKLAAAFSTQSTQSVSFTPERIVIEKVSIDLPVESVPLKNGTWEVNPHVANFAEGTSVVNSINGNVGIYAHDTIDAFSKIKQVLTGYDILVFGKTYRATYKVDSATVIAPAAIDVFFPTKEPTLTLITCEGVFSDKRYMVKATLVKIEKIK